MKKFNWKVALEKRWMELLIAAIWLVSAIVNFYRAYNTNEFSSWVAMTGAAFCCPCWIYIFYKRAKRDGC